MNAAERIRAYLTARAHNYGQTPPRAVEVVQGRGGHSVALTEADLETVLQMLDLLAAVVTTVGRGRTDPDAVPALLDLAAERVDVEHQAAGAQTPGQLTTIADLDALPRGTVIIDANQDVHRKYYKHASGTDTWYGMANNPGPYRAHELMLPARVIA